MKVDRSNLAIQSWKDVRKHFHNSPFSKYLILMKITDCIEEQNLNSQYHASTSHDTLCIQAKHRYDAKVDKLCIDEQDGILKFRYIVDNTKNILESSCSSHYIQEFMRQFKQLTEKYQVD